MSWQSMTEEGAKKNHFGKLDLDCFDLDLDCFEFVCKFIRPDQWFMKVGLEK